MPLKSKPLPKARIAAYEATRDLAAEILEAVREMKAGRLYVVSSPATINDYHSQVIETIRFQGADGIDGSLSCPDAIRRGARKIWSRPQQIWPCPRCLQSFRMQADEVGDRWASEV